MLEQEVELGLDVVPERADLAGSDQRGVELGRALRHPVRQERAPRVSDDDQLALAEALPQVARELDAVGDHARRNGRDGRVLAVCLAGAGLIPLDDREVALVDLVQARQGRLRITGPRRG